MNDILNAVASYMESTEVLKNATAIKIASLEDTNRGLATKQQAMAESVGALVSKMASAGIINDIQAAHLSTVARNVDVAQSIDKLNALLDSNASKKVATAPQLYTVAESSQDELNNNNAEIEASWMSRLNSLGRKA